MKRKLSELWSVPVKDIERLASPTDFEAEFKADTTLFIDYFQFEQEIKDRWEKQKSLSPSNPYSFRMPELDLTMKYMSYHIDKKILSYENTELNPILSAEKKFFELVKNELIQVNESGLEYDFFLKVVENYTKAFAVASKDKIAKHVVLYNKFMQSTVEDAITELTYYKNNPTYYENYTDRFIVNNKLIFNDKDFKVLLLPLIGYLEYIHFIKTRYTNVILSTLTHKNYFIDGYPMTPYTFQKHDVSYHASMRYKADMKYYAERGWNDKDISNFKLLQKEWCEHLIHEVEAIDDYELKDSVYWMLLEVLHNRGWVLAPSSFLNRFDQIHIRARNDIKNLSLVLLDKCTGCGSTFNTIFSRAKKAQHWITDFWESNYSDTLY